MTFPYPSENQDPWFTAFEDFVNALDASGYAAREDRQLIPSGGGQFTLDATGDSLTWDATLEILSPISGFRIDVPAATVTMEDGDALYVELVRSPTTNVVSAGVVATQVPSSDTAYVIGIRRGAVVYFRHGVCLPDGVAREIFTADTGPVIIQMGGRESHSSDVTPLVVGAIAFTPVTHDPVTSLVFRAVAANGDVSLTNKVQLFNVTDSVLVAELSFTSTATAKDEVTLTRGTGAGEIDDPEHIYEVRLLLGAAPGGPSETIELYSAELRLI